MADEDDAPEPDLDQAYRDENPATMGAEVFARFCADTGMTPDEAEQFLAGLGQGWERWETDQAVQEDTGQ